MGLCCESQVNALFLHMMPHLQFLIVPGFCVWIFFSPPFFFLMWEICLIPAKYCLSFFSSNSSISSFWNTGLELKLVHLMFLIESKVLGSSLCPMKAAYIPGIGVVLKAAFTSDYLFCAEFWNSELL